MRMECPPMVVVPDVTGSFAGDLTTEYENRGIAITGSNAMTVTGALNEKLVVTKGEPVPATDAAFDVSDKLVFQVIAKTLNQDNMREGAGLFTPTRQSVSNDPEVGQKYRFIKPAADTIQAGARLIPTNPEFSEAILEVTQNLQKGLTWIWNGRYGIFPRGIVKKLVSSMPFNMSRNF